MSLLIQNGFKFRNQGISERVKDISVSAIKEMMILAQGMEDVISFAQGIPSFLIAKHIRERIKKELDENDFIGKYTPVQGLKKLRENISKKLFIEKGIKPDPEREILITAGAMEAVVISLITILNPGEEILIPTPDYASHYAQIKIAGGVPKYIPLIEEKEEWRLNVEAFEKSITSKTKAIILTNPSNPTGAVFKKQDLLDLAEIVKKHNLFLILDNPYYFVIYDGIEYFDLVSLKELKQNIIACYSFSKEYALTGLRVGYIYSDEGIINQLMKVHDAVIVSAPSISQYAALEALEGEQDVVEYYRKVYKERRDLMMSKFDELQDLFEYKKPQGAYYIFPKIKKKISDTKLALRLLKEAKVITVPGSAFGPSGKGHLRFCFAGTESQIEEGMERIKKWYEKNRIEL